jgi:transposase InsO family protein/transposase-like protein
MAQKVTAMDIRTATALVGQVDNVAKFCADHMISRQTFYKWRRRFEADGLQGLHERSRRPHTATGQTPAAVEEVVLRKRKQLIESGCDHGAQSIRWELEKDPTIAFVVPAVATIWRILVRHGAITPTPRKRPKSADRRFTFARPNECWQSDWTHWQLAGGITAAIAGSLDDHSRYLTGLRAMAGDANGEFVWSVMLSAIDECGIPALSLTDNGRAYNQSRLGWETRFETNLRALGTKSIASRPYHPQTCGKIERFWQTLKKWLAAHDPAATVEELNELLEQFRQYYNHERRHRALRGATPAEAFAATAKARPADRPLPAPVFVGREVVNAYGGINTGRYRVSVGVRWSGHACDFVVDGDHIVIFSGHRLVRELVADPGRRHQPTKRQPGTYGKREPKPAS